jgi:DNA-binding NtrC family response regulator
MTSRTLSTIGAGRASGSPKLERQLFLLLEQGRPLAGSWRLALDPLDSVVLGRAEARSATRARTGGAETLTLGVPDARMSSRHARLVRVGARWVLEDTDSKNGVLLDGVPERRATLTDGVVFELGHTSFLYREAPAGDGPAPDRTPEAAEEHAAPHPAFATLSSALEGDFERLSRVAGSRVPVLVRGESGTGKELIARAVHDVSRRTGRFVAINCGELPPALLESELFGYRRGAFSGATADREGLVRAADGGTLFLDEIGDLAPSSQAALLRVLQEGEVRRVGATEPEAVDVRFVAATHRDLDAMVASGAFRGDLLARLSGYAVRLPPLRERKEDLGLLVGRLLARHMQGSPTPALSPEAARALIAHDYPLNVRELEQALAAAVALARGGSIGADDLPEAIRRGAAPAPADPVLGEEDSALRTDLVLRLEAAGGNVAEVARALGKDRKQVHRWIERLKIPLGEFR